MGQHAFRFAQTGDELEATHHALLRERVLEAEETSLNTRTSQMEGKKSPSSHPPKRLFIGYVHW